MTATRCQVFGLKIMSSIDTPSEPLSSPNGAEEETKRVRGLSPYHFWVEVALALVLLAAGGLKSYQLFFKPDSLAPGLLHSKIFVGGLVQVELLLGTWLLMGGLNRIRFFVAFICFVLFATVAGYEAMRALPSCGCFGLLKVSPKITVGLDLLAIVLLWITRPRARQNPGKIVHRAQVVVPITLALVVSGIFWLKYFQKSAPAALPDSTNDLVVLEPASWVNKQFALFDEIDGGGPLRRGRWLLVFYHYDCDSCREAIPIYETLATATSTKPGSPKIAFIAMPPIAPPDQEPVSSSSHCLRLTLLSDHDWFATTPVVAALDDGNVLWADDGDNAVHPPSISQWP